MSSAKKLGAVVLAGALVMGSVGVYRYHKDTVLDWFLEFRPGGRSSNNVSLFFMSYIDAKTLRVNLIVRCKDRRQKREVLRKEPRIVHGLIDSARQPRLVASIRDRDLERLRKYWMQTINEAAGSPVESVHLERFFFN